MQTPTHHSHRVQGSIPAADNTRHWHSNWLAVQNYDPQNSSLPYKEYCCLIFVVLNIGKIASCVSSAVWQGYRASSELRWLGVKNYNPQNSSFPYKEYCYLIFVVLNIGNITSCVSGVVCLKQLVVNSSDSASRITTPEQLLTHTRTITVSFL